MKRPFAVLAVVSGLLIALVSQAGAVTAQSDDRLNVDYEIRNFATGQVLDSRGTARFTRIRTTTARTRSGKWSTRRTGWPRSAMSRRTWCWTAGDR